MTLATVQPSKAPQTMQVSRSTQRLAALGLGTAAAILALEIALRLADPYGISYFSEIDRYFSWLNYGGPTLYEHRAGECARFQGVDICTNELGLRTESSRSAPSSPQPPESKATVVPFQPPHPRPLPPGEREKDFPSPSTGEGVGGGERSAILFLGDSVVLGWGVPFGETLGEHLERRLRERGLPMSVVNAGVASYNTEQEAAQLERLFPVVRPAAVLLLFGSNDVESKVDEQRRRSEWKRRAWHFGRSHSRLAAASEYLLRRVRASARPDRFAPDHSRWAATRKAIEKMVGLCRREGVPFSIMFFSHLTDDDAREAVARLSELAANLGFPFLDASPAFLNSGPLDELTNSVSDRHPNGKGHAILAEAALDLLGRSGIGALAVER